MSNDNPPRACLADFGFMTMVLDPDQPMSCSAQLEGGTLAFMSPELLVPSDFEVENPIPTPEADVYAFGLVIYQVCKQDRGYLSFTYIVQVLTGEIPFRGLRMTEIPTKVLRGVRPLKPENASAIGFSDSLWSFVQRCWDGKMKLRPEVAEVVSQLEEAATSRDGVMPPHAKVERVVFASPEPVSDPVAYCKLWIPILP
jgi:serine/threonine protein kinase